MAASRVGLKVLIRDGLRNTIPQTLSAVIQEVTGEELRTALRDPAFREPLMEVIKLELKQAIEDLRGNGGSRKRSRR